MAGRFALFVLGGLLFVRVVRTTDLRAALVLLHDLGWRLPLALLPYLVIVGLDTVGWRVILREIQAPVGLLRLLRVRLATESLLLGLPGGSVFAETLKPALLLRDGVPASVSTASLAGKKALQVGSQGAYFLLAAGLAWQPLADLSQRIGARGLLGPGIIVAGVVLILGGLGMAGLLVSAHVAQRIYRLLRAVPVTRIRSWVSAHEQGFRNTDDLTRQLLSNLSANAPVPFAWLGASWVMESVESWLLLLLLGVHLGFTEVLAFEPAVSLLRSLAFFLPGGLGVQDAAYLQALQSPSASVVLPPATAAAFVLLKRFKEVFWIVTGFGVLAGMGRARS